MKDIFILEGKKYISSRRASEISDYASDYIGQLCRAEKLDCRMIGRTWFVTEESLRLHKMSVADGEQVRNRIENLRGKKSTSTPTTGMSSFLSSLVSNSSVSNIPSTSASVSNDASSFTSTATSITPSFIYKNDERPLLPVLNRETVAPVVSGVVLPQSVASSSTSFEVSPRSAEVVEVGPQTESASQTQTIVGQISKDISFNTLTRSIILSRALKVGSVVFGLLLIFTVATFDFNSFGGNSSSNGTNGSENTASIGSFLRSLLGGLTSKNPQIAVNTNTNPEISNATSTPLGVAVVGSSGSNAQDEATKKKIADSFSDNVEVKADKSGTAGVIKPVFKQTNGQDFIYVLVPVNKKSP